MNGKLLNFLYGILVVLLILSIWLKIDELKKKINPVIKPLGDNNYQVGHLIFIPDDKKIYHNKVGYNMTIRTAEILLLILKDPQKRISTRKLLDICINMENMSSAMNRVKRVLKDSDCPFKFIPSTGDPFYTLESRYKTDSADPTIVKWMIYNLTVGYNCNLKSIKSYILKLLQKWGGRLE